MIREVSIDAFADILRERTTIKADAVVIIDGMPGTGKSSLQIELCRRIDPAFTMRRNIVFDPNPKVIMDKVTKELPAGSAIGLDEIIRAANARKAMTAYNIFLTEYFALNRKDFKVIFLTLPSIMQIDSSLRNYRATFWVHVIERGVALVFKRSRMPADGDPWGLGEKGSGIKRLIKANHTGRAFDLSTEEIMNTLSKHDNFAFMVKFDPMPKEIEVEYEACAAEMRKELKLPEERGHRMKLYRLQIQKMVAHLIEADGMTQQQIEDLFGMDRTTVSTIMRKEGAWALEDK
jgi:predicted XRE-type DNA-binding protein